MSVPVVIFIPRRPIVEDQLNGFWILHDPMKAVLPDGSMVEIPKGFLTDFASIPTILDWIPGLDTNGTQGDPAFILHDYIYGMHRKGIDVFKTRKEADELMYWALISCGFSRFRAGMIYYGVRIGGSRAWEGKR